MLFMRIPSEAENADDILVLEYEGERLLVSLTTNEERYKTVLKYVKRQWGIEKNEAVFETDELPVCKGSRVKMHSSVFLPSITGAITVIHVSKINKNSDSEEGNEAPAATVVESRVEESVNPRPSSVEERKTEINKVGRLLELTDLAIDRDNETDKSSSDETIIMIDRGDVQSVASDDSDESAPYDALADSNASIGRSEKSYGMNEYRTRYNRLAESASTVESDRAHYGALADSTRSVATTNKVMEDSELYEARKDTLGDDYRVRATVNEDLSNSNASMTQSEVGSEAEGETETETEKTSTPGTPDLSIREMQRSPIKKERNFFIRVHKNRRQEPAVVFKVKGSHSVRTTFSRACRYLNLDPSKTSIYWKNTLDYLHMDSPETMASVCADGSDFIIYGREPETFE